MVWNWLRRHSVLADIALVVALLAGYVGHAAHLDQWTGGVPLAVLQHLTSGDYRRLTRGSATRRATVKMWRRNAAIAMANQPPTE